MIWLESGCLYISWGWKCDKDSAPEYWSIVFIANGKAEEPAGTQESVVFIYKVNLNFKVFAIFTEKRLIMLITKGVKVLRRGAENDELQDVP